MSSSSSLAFTGGAPGGTAPPKSAAGAGNGKTRIMAALVFVVIFAVVNVVIFIMNIMWGCKAATAKNGETASESLETGGSDEATYNNKMRDLVGLGSSTVLLIMSIAAIYMSR